VRFNSAVDTFGDTSCERRQTGQLLARVRCYCIASYFNFVVSF